VKSPHKNFAALWPLILVVLATGCQSTPSPAVLELPPESLADRQMQTRRFDGVAEADLLAACAGVLQDLGFNLDDSEAALGVIVASKHRSAGEPVKATLAWLLDVFIDIEIEVDKEQRIRVSLVTRPVADVEQAFLVRVTFQRIVWNTENKITERQVLNDPELHQQFFENLSKSVFLEANSI
jgi:hypothetical protein